MVAHSTRISHLTFSIWPSQHPIFQTPLVTLCIIPWNIGHLSSSLPCIQELLQIFWDTPQITLIQETKMHKHKTMTYIDRRFPDYKIIYNNFNKKTTQIGKKHTPHQPQQRGGVMALIHLSIYSNENVTEVSTSTNISPYLQAFKITTNLSPPSSSYTHTCPHIKKTYTLSCI